MRNNKKATFNLALETLVEIILGAFFLIMAIIFIAQFFTR